MVTNTAQQATPEVPDVLYHALLNVVDFNEDTSGYTRTTYPLGTHTSLPAAKSFASRALEQLNYQSDDFAEYAVRDQEGVSADWPYGDSVIVFAKAPGGQEFLVRLDTTPNTEGLPGVGPDGALTLPHESDHLHYVIRTRVDYDQDRGGGLQTTDIEGVYVRESDAVEAAKGMLGTREEYAQYDERRDDEEGQWPFGEDVVVHAVAQTGQDYTVAVRTVAGSHRKYGRKAKAGEKKVRG